MLINDLKGDFMKNIVKIIIVAIMLTLFASITSAATLSLDFSSTDNGRYFKTITGGTGKWKASGGKLEFTQVRGDPGMADAWQNIIQFVPKVDDFTIQFDLMQNDNDYMMITFGSAQSLIRHTGQKGYGIRFLNDKVNPGQRGAVLSKTTTGNDSYTDLTRAAQSVSGYFVNTIKIVKSGTNIKLYIKNDDTDLDPDNLNPPNDGISVLLDYAIEDLDGYIQLFSGNGRCTIDNFKITAEGANFTLPATTTAPTPTKASNATPAPTTATVSKLSSSIISNISSDDASSLISTSDLSSEEYSSSISAISESQSASSESQTDSKSDTKPQNDQFPTLIVIAIALVVVGTGTATYIIIKKNKGK